MILRLVKMHFKSEETDDFLDYFNSIKAEIKAMPGIIELQIYRDANNPDIVFTKSMWKSEQFLDNYRKSELFGKVWPNTKKRFQGKPEAWSLILN